MSEIKNPYSHLGSHLKQLRERASESVAECSGAVEIDVTDLLRYEQGKKRPSEEILLLLISHFALKEDEAMKLWELAGYANDKLPNSHVTTDELGDIIQQVVVMPIDMRIAYSDRAHVAANKEGVIINFMQNTGMDSKQNPIARVGMSRVQAENLAKVIAESLNHSLPIPKKKSSDTKDQ